MGATHRSFAPWRARAQRSPIEGESLDGYLSFRAAEERLPTTTPITSLAGIRHVHRPEVTLTGEGIDVIADCLQVDPAELAARVYPLEVPTDNVKNPRRAFFGTLLHRRFFENYTRRFSPASLAKSPHHRALWSLRVFPFCDESWEMLTSACGSPHCGVTQRWRHTNGIDRCDKCGRTLVVSEVETVPVELQSSLRLLVGLVHPDPARREKSRAALPDAVHEAGAGAILELAVALVGFIDPALRSSRHVRFVRSDAPALAVTRALASAWDVLAGWPETFETIAAERLAERTGRFGDGNRETTVELLALSRSGAVLDGMALLLAKLEQRLQANGDRGLDCKTAALVTGLSPRRIAGLRRIGILPAVFHLDGDRPHPLIEKAATERLALSLRSTVTMTAASITLGIPRYGVEQLVGDSMLSLVIAAATASGLDVPRVSSMSVERLEADIAARGRKPCRDFLYPLSSALSGMPGLKPWGPALTALARGVVPCVVLEGEDPPSARIMLDAGGRGQLRALRFDPDDDRCASFFDLMSKRDAAEVLNLHARHALPLLDRWPTPVGKGASVPVGEVLALAKKYVSPAEFGDICGLVPTAVRHEADRLGLERASPAGFLRTGVEAAFGRPPDQRCSGPTHRTRLVRVPQSREPEVGHLISARAPPGEGGGLASESARRLNNQA